MTEIIKKANIRNKMVKATKTTKTRNQIKSLRIKYIKGLGSKWNNNLSDAFMITDGDLCMLYNCGNGVLDFLIDEDMKNNTFNMSKINLVYISDINDTSIGSLKSFIRYQHEVYNIVTKVYCEQHISDFVNDYLQDINYIIINHQIKQPQVMWKLYPLNKNKLYQNLFGDNLVIMDNGESINHLMAIRKNKQWLVISGTTNYIPHIEKFIRMNRWENVVIFQQTTNNSLIQYKDMKYSPHLLNKIYGYGCGSNTFDYKQVSKLKQYRYSKVKEDISYE